MSYFSKFFKKNQESAPAEYISPVTFLNPHSTLGELDFHLIAEGRHERLLQLGQFNPILRTLGAGDAGDDRSQVDFDQLGVIDFAQFRNAPEALGAVVVFVGLAMRVAAASAAQVVD